MAADKAKSGAVTVDEYEAPEYLESLAPLARKLQEQFPGSKFDPKSTGQFVAQIRQFMEDALGVKSILPRPFPKLPARLFQDLQPGGSLHLILTRFHAAMAAQGLKRVDFVKPILRPKFLDMVTQSAHELRAAGHLRWPRVWLDPSCAAEAPALQKIVTSLRGELAPQPDAPGVTHHVFPFGPRGDPDDGVQYMRNLGKRSGGRAMVHWWYFPDSYDELVAAESAPEVIEPDKQPEGPWRVYLRWLKDAARYNEWMNPIDYEIDDVPPLKEEPAPGAPLGAAAAATAPSASAAPAAAAEAGKRKREEAEQLAPAPAPAALPATSVAPLAAFAAMPMPQLQVHVLEVAPVGSVAIAPGLTRQQLLAPDKQADEAGRPSINLSQGQPPKAPPPQPAGAGRQREPAHAAWLDRQAIHEREAAACPLLLPDGPQSAQAEQYKELRNSLIDRCRAEPGKRLALPDAVAAAPAGASKAGVGQLWRLLDHWGLLNWRCPAEPAQLDAAAAAAGELPAAEAAERLLATRPWPTQAHGLAAAAGGPLESPLQHERPPCNPARVREERFVCDVTGAECGRVRYACLTRPGLALSPQAWAAGRLPAGCAASDFVRIDQADAAAQGQEGVWTDQDTLLLLEGLEQYGDNWAEVSDHVGTKSQVQCILHFLRLPIQDSILDALETGPDSDAAQQQQQQARVQAEPFAPGHNPVTLQVALLASAVDSKVAAAAAQASLESLMAGAGDAGAAGDPPPDAQAMAAAAQSGLEAAAAKARALAAEEERAAAQLLRQALREQQRLSERRVQQAGGLAAALAQDRAAQRARREQVAERARAAGSGQQQ